MIIIDYEKSNNINSKEKAKINNEVITEIRGGQNLLKNLKVNDKIAKKHYKKYYEWNTIHVINPNLSREDISDIINKKIARIIIEKEHNQIHYEIDENLPNNNCKIKRKSI